jgi:ATP-dependent protease ClpP protease subunit
MREPYCVTKRIIQNTTTTYEYELFDYINSHDQYADLRYDLYNASENDSFIIKINSPGGCVDVGMMIVKAIQETRARTISRVMFPSASMASVIAVSCQGMHMDDDSFLMFHTYSAGSYGKANELIASTANWHDSLVGMDKSILMPKDGRRCGYLCTSK